MPTVLGLCALIGACQSECDTDSDPEDRVVYEAGRVDATGTEYETNAFDETYLDFPPGRRYELVHGLNDKPRHIGIFVSFSPEPLTSGGELAPAAGNQAVVERVDDQVVWVRNDTCADLYVRVELSTFPSSASDSGAGGAPPGVGVDGSLDGG